MRSAMPSPSPSSHNGSQQFNRLSGTELGAFHTLPNLSANDPGPQPLYWSKDDLQPTTLKFMALLDTSAWDTKITPYFNNAATTIITPEDFQKMKAILSVIPTSKDAINDPEIIANPDELMDLLERHIQLAEFRLNQCLPSGVKHVPTTTWKEVDKQGVSSLKLQTEHLFIESNKTSLFGAKPGANVDTMPDPIYRYGQLFRKEPTMAKYRIVTPDIKDHDGSIIPPAEYQFRLSVLRMAPVKVEVVPRVWDIRPTKDKRKCPNGSRTYQLVIKSIQLLPEVKKTPLPTRMPPTPYSPLKRRRTEGSSEASPSKKPKF